MKKQFLLPVLGIAGFSHAAFAMKALDVTPRHMRDVVRLAGIISNHDQQAYESYPNKEGLPYDALEPLLVHNGDVFLKTWDSELRALHRMIAKSLSVLIEKQRPIHQAAVQKYWQDVGILEEYKYIKECEKKYAQKKKEELLASAQKADNEQENVLISK